MDKVREIYTFLKGLKKAEREWLFRFLPLIEKGDDILYIGQAGILSLKNCLAFDSNFKTLNEIEAQKVIDEFVSNQESWLKEEIEILENINQLSKQLKSGKLHR